MEWIKLRRTYKIIAACGENNELGDGHDLLWHLPKDMAFFKKKTTGATVIMGRKTYESFPEKYRPLPNRKNIVITRQKNYDVPEEVLLCKSLKEAFSIAEKDDAEKYIIGGGSIYEQSLPFADIIFLTRIHTTFPAASVFFPKLDHKEWIEVWREDHTKDDRHGFDFSFIEYHRQKNNL